MSTTPTRELHVDVDDLRRGDLVHTDNDQAIKVHHVVYEDEHVVHVKGSMTTIMDDGTEARLILVTHPKATVRVSRPRPAYQIAVEITPDSDVVPEDVAINVETYLKGHYSNAVVKAAVI